MPCKVEPADRGERRAILGQRGHEFLETRLASKRGAAPPLDDHAHEILVGAEAKGAADRADGLAARQEFGRQRPKRYPRGQCDTLAEGDHLAGAERGHEGGQVRASVVSAEHSSA